MKWEKSYGRARSLMNGRTLQLEYVRVLYRACLSGLMYGKEGKGSMLGIRRTDRMPNVHVIKLCGVLWRVAHAQIMVNSRTVQSAIL